MTKISIRDCSHLLFLETGSDTKAIYFADSAMIVHVVPESAEVSSCGLRNISRVAVQCIWRRAGDGRTIIIYIYIYRLRTFNSSMWGSLRLAPTSLVRCIAADRD